MISIISNSTLFNTLLKDVLDLSKFRLSIFIVFTSVLGYLLGTDSFDLLTAIFLFLGGFLITVSANIFNQIIEKDSDKLMKRTHNRPLPTNRLSVTSAYLIAGITSSLGLFFLYNISELVALIGAISLLFYAFLYTPLKPITSFSVYVGAIPGALPPMIGVVAARGEIDSLAIYLFLIQFLWQFPHFWAIAWKAYDEYANAGFYLLPQKGGRNNINAVTIFCSSIATVSLAIIGYFWLDISLLISCLIAIMGFGMVYFSYILMSDLSDKSALRLMFYTLIYLPVTFILLFF